MGFDQVLLVRQVSDKVPLNQSLCETMILYAEEYSGMCTCTVGQTIPFISPCDWTHTRDQVNISSNRDERDEKTKIYTVLLLLLLLQWGLTIDWILSLVFTYFLLRHIIIHDNTVKSTQHKAGQSMACMT